MFTQGSAKNRLFGLLFLFFLVASVFTPIFQVQAEPDEEYWIRISTGEIIGFRGNPVTITVASNASQVTVKIFNPNQVEIYSQNWSGNESRNIPIPTQADYGMYTITAFAPNAASTTWFTVLDVSNWSSASFPYTRYHKGVTYTFYANGTLLADNGEDVLNIDLSTIRFLISHLNLNANTYYNNMNFRVRLTRASFAVDMTFSFIHTGCKFTINGTIDQARSFTFRVAEPNQLKSLVDSIKVGNLVFDYGDFHKLEYAFSYDEVAGELTVNIPKTFWIDPTIFQDGLESNDFTEWTSTFEGTGDSITTEEASANTGTYGANCTTDASSTHGAYAYKNLTQAYNNVTLQFYYQINANLGTWKSIVAVYALNATVNSITTIKNNDNNWRTYARNGSTTTFDDTTSATSEGTWYNITIVITETSVTSYKDGSLLSNITEVEADYWGVVGGFTLGILLEGDMSSSFDDVIVSSDYSAGDSTAPTYSSLSTSTTVAGASCQFNATFTDETALESDGQYEFGWNSSSTWAWDSAVNFTSTPETISVSKTLNSTAELVIGYQWNFTDNAGNSNNTGIQTLTTTNIYLTLQARDKDATNLPRAANIQGTLANSSSLDVDTDTSGSYSLATTYGSHTFTVWWQNHLVNSSISYSATANASLNLDTLIARLDSGSNYVLVSVNTTTLSTPALQANDGWKIDNVVGTAQKQACVDLANWGKSTEPLYFKIGGSTYNKAYSGWSWSSSIFTFNYVDFDAFPDPTLEMTWDTTLDGGRGGYVPPSPTPPPSDETPAPAPTTPSPYEITPAIPALPSAFSVPQLIGATVIIVLVSAGVYLYYKGKDRWATIGKKAKVNFKKKKRR